MRVSYRGHEINVERGVSLGGDSNIYYSIFRDSDGYECTSGFTSDTSTVKEFIGYMKERVDGELASDDPWDEMFKDKQP